MRFAVRTAVVVTVGLAGAAHADRLELGIAAGARNFSDSAELGVDDDMDAGAPSTGGLLGARIGVRVVSRLVAEGELVAVATKVGEAATSATVIGARAQLRFDLLAGRVRPFLLAGIGLDAMRTSSMTPFRNDSDRTYQWGGGVTVQLGRRVDVRLDLRHLVVPDRTLDGATSELELTAGVAYRFGREPIRSPRLREESDASRPAQATVAEPVSEAPLVVERNEPDVVEPEPAEPVVVAAPREPLHALTGIAFSAATATITPEGNDEIDRAARILIERDDVSVEVAGFVGSREKVKSKAVMELSLRRAQRVRAVLVRRGIAEARVRAVGHGTAPVEGGPAIQLRVLAPDEL